MSERNPRNVPEGDLPWNDVPADSDVVPGSEEPDPAEVEGDDGDEVDVSHPASPDPYLKYQQESSTSDSPRRSPTARFSSRTPRSVS